MRNPRQYSLWDGLWVQVSMLPAKAQKPVGSGLTMVTPTGIEPVFSP
jgi:hypothetical protein